MLAPASAAFICSFDTEQTDQIVARTKMKSFKMQPDTRRKMFLIYLACSCYFVAAIRAQSENAILDPEDDNLAEICQESDCIGAGQMAEELSLSTPPQEQESLHDEFEPAALDQTVLSESNSGQSFNPEHHLHDDQNRSDRMRRLLQTYSKLRRLKRKKFDHLRQDVARAMAWRHVISVTSSFTKQTRDRLGRILRQKAGHKARHFIAWFMQNCLIHNRCKLDRPQMDRILAESIES